MELIYIDPPYLGKGRYYDEHHPESREADSLEWHDDLIQKAVGSTNPWIYSCSADTLMKIFLILPGGVRIGSWHKSPMSRSSWEPVIFSPGFPYDTKWYDSFSDRSPNHSGLIGAKPEAFYWWIFTAVKGRIDVFTEWFPGSGSGDRAFQAYKRQIPLFPC